MLHRSLGLLCACLVLSSGCGPIPLIAIGVAAGTGGLGGSHPHGGNNSGGLPSSTLPQPPAAPPPPSSNLPQPPAPNNTPTATSSVTVTGISPSDGPIA